MGVLDISNYLSEGGGKSKSKSLLLEDVGAGGIIQAQVEGHEENP